MGYVLGLVAFFGVVVGLGLMLADVQDLLDYHAIPPVRDLTGYEIFADRLFWFFTGTMLGACLFASFYLVATNGEK